MIHMVVAGMDIIGFFNYDEAINLDDLIKADGRFYRVNAKRRLVDERGNVFPVLDTTMAMRNSEHENIKS